MRYAKAILFSAAVLSIGAAQAAPAGRPLSPLELVQRGFPATDHVWDRHDYEAALSVLQTLKPEQYPTLTNPISAPVVEKMTAPAVLRSCNNDINTLMTRMATCAYILQPVGKILELYSNAVVVNNALATDLVRILCFALDVGTELELMGDAAGAKLDKRGPTYAQQAAGLDQMHRGSLEMLQGSIALLDQAGPVPVAARVELALTIAKDYPRMAGDLPPLTRIQFEKTLSKIAAHDSNVAVRAALAKLGGH